MPAWQYPAISTSPHCYTPSDLVQMFAFTDAESRPDGTRGLDPSARTPRPISALSLHADA
jgi:hypothetical protein